MRRERKLTLKVLGSRAGLSHPFLSQVERGLARPSLGSVERLAAALDVPVARLWSPPREGDEVAVIRRDEGAAGEGGMRELPLFEGVPVLREWTAPSRRWPRERDVDSGEIAIYVARGAIEVELQDTVHALSEGDALRFDASTPHRMRRTGPVSTRALIVAAG